VRARPTLVGLVGFNLLVTLGVGIGVGTAAAAVGAAPAVAPAITAISLATRQTAVHSSRHDPLDVSVNATRHNSKPLGPSSVSVEITTPNQVESHTWIFPVPTAALNAKTSGSGTLVVPHADIAPFGTIKLTFTALSKPVKTVCNSVAYSTSQKVSVKGAILFDTHSTGKDRWGSVGSTSLRFTFKQGSTLVKDFGANTGCPGGSLPPCSYSLLWLVDSANQLVSLEGGTTGKTGGFIDAVRTENLSKPKHASRVDEVDTPTGRPTVAATGASTIALSIKSGHAAKGSATMDGTADGSPTTSVCGKGNTTSSSVWTAAFANNTPRLVIKEAVFGPITMATSAKPDAEILQFGTAPSG
jgi:hypothetical protein